ncbi:MAG TPA: SRPBCC family protein [Candidatus Limnocylindria bacterium]|nr:SRPBCC family protein [Candidatus Limnocylindria bacterium]
MWREVEVRAHIDEPVDRIFAYLVDPPRWHEFAPACVLRRPMGNGPVAVGARWEAADRIGPFTIRFVDELAELQPNRRVVWLSSAPWNARVEYVCVETPRGTLIRARYGGAMSGWMRLVGLVPRPVMGWILAQDFRRLGALLGAERQAAPQIVGTDV